MYLEEKYDAVRQNLDKIWHHGDKFGQETELFTHERQKSDEIKAKSRKICKQNSSHKILRIMGQPLWW